MGVLFSLNFPVAVVCCLLFFVVMFASLGFPRLVSLHPGMRCFFFFFCNLQIDIFTACLCVSGFTRKHSGIAV